MLVSRHQYNGNPRDDYRYTVHGCHTDFWEPCLQILQSESGLLDALTNHSKPVLLWIDIRYRTMIAHKMLPDGSQPVVR